MRKAILVEIDQTGHIHPVEPATTIPEGRAILTWPDEDEDPNLPLLLSEAAFSKELFNEEEDAAWAYLQPVK